MEKYWEEKEISEEIKETWVRMRYGIIGSERYKGFADTKCRLCQLHEETLTHICNCEGANRKMADGLKEWIG